MKINSNITALMTMTYMNKATNNASTAVNRLSSGYKINKASDSPAGWAIANQLLGQSDGLKQANRNSMDAISLVQTTEGALNEINSMLNRIRDLCVEAVNDSNTGSDRQNMQDEIDQLITEINSITQRTDFNGVKMLNNRENITIQTGANAYEMLEISGDKTSMSDVLTELVDFNVLKLKDNEVVTALKDTVKEYTIDRSVIDELQVILNDVQVDILGNKILDENGNPIPNDPKTSEEEMRKLIHEKVIHPNLFKHDKENTVKTGDPITDTLINKIEDTIDDKEKGYIGSESVMSIIAMYMPKKDTDEYKAVQKNCNGLIITLEEYQSNTISTDKAVEKIHDIIHPTRKAEKEELRQSENAEITNLIEKVEKLVKPSNISDIEAINGVKERVNKYESNRYESLKEKLNNIMNSYVTDNEQINEKIYKPLQAAIKKYDGKTTPKEDVDSLIEKITEVISQEEVNEKDVLENAINKIDRCVTHVTDIRSMLGAYQNRLESIVANLGVSEENTTEALSRIRDADMAEEITEYTLQNVIAQAGISMLSQANQRPQQILQLLAQ